MTWVIRNACTAKVIIFQYQVKSWMILAISRKERQCELLALAGGGIPVFLMMLMASVSRQPLEWLLPVIVGVIFTSVLICYDEFIFHRKRCQKLETRLHRILVLGNGVAWLAWAHWCFVERAQTLA